MKHLRTIGLVAIGAAVVFGISGCGWFADEVARALAAPDGYVFNVTDGTPLSNATVTLTAADGETLETNTGSDGYYKFEDIEYGVFELTAEKAGYAFTKQRIEVSGLAQRLPNIGGYEPGDEVFRIVVFWNESFADLDAYLTMPVNEVGSAAVDPSDFYSTTTVVPAGFFPDGSVNRQKVYWDNPLIEDPALDPATIVALDVDNQGKSGQPDGGPETISVYWIPFLADYDAGQAYTPVSADKSGLAIGTSYTWVGTMDYWLDAWAEDNSGTAAAPESATALLASQDFSNDTADPVVYIFDDQGNQKGSFVLPDQDMATAGVIRINMYVDAQFNEYFQFLPNIRAFNDDASIRSLDGSLLPFVIKGKSRG